MCGAGIVGAQDDRVIHERLIKQRKGVPWNCFVWCLGLHMSVPCMLCVPVWIHLMLLVLSEEP